MADRVIRARLVADVQGYVQGLRTAGRETVNFGRAVTANTKEAHVALERMHRGVLLAGGAMGAALALTAKAAIDWESAWAGVEKTVDGTTAQMAGLEESLREMARTLPASHAEIAGVAEAAGALGVEAGAIEGFTRVMIDLGETTDLTADAAATAFARIANVMGTSQQDFDRMGATIVELGNNGASTESEIAELANRLAAAGAIAGLSEADVFAFAESLASVGVEAEAGGTAMSKVFTAIRDAVLDGSDKLEVFAQVAGQTSSDFAASFRQGPALAIASFIEGLGRLNESGASTTGVFTELELTDQRLMRALLSTGEAGDYLRGQIDLASQAWSENTALTDEAGKRYDTTAAKLEVFRNNVSDAAIEIGGHLLPILSDAADGAGTLARGFGELPGPLQVAGLGIGGVSTAGLTLLGTAGFLIPKIHEAKDALNNLGVGGQFVARNMGRATAALGVAGIALAGLSFYLGEQAKKQAEAKAEAEAYTQAIIEQGSAIGDLTDQHAANAILTGSLGENLRSASADMDVFLDALHRNGDGIRDLNDAWDDFPLALQSSTSTTDRLRSALDDAGLSGSEFADELLRLVEAAGLSGDDLNDLINILTEQAAAHAAGAVEAENDAAANEAAGVAAEGAAGGQDALTQALAETEAQAEATQEALDNYINAVRASTDPLFGMVDALHGNRDAQLDYQQALRDVQDAQTELDAVMADGSSTTADIAEAHRNLEDALRGAEQANYDVAASAVDVETAQRDLAVAVATHQVSVEAATEMLYGWVDAGLMTAEQAAVVAQGFRDAEADAQNAEGEYVMELLAEDHATGPITQLDHRLDLLDGRSVTIPIWIQQRGSINQIEHSLDGHATGGLIGGTGHGDTELAWLTPGEYVLRKSAVEAVGVDRLNEINKYATGGIVGQAQTSYHQRQQMIGNVGGTAVGRNTQFSIRKAGGDAAEVRQALEGLTDTYQELIDKIGLASANELIHLNLSADAFEEMAQMALDAADAVEEAAERQAELVEAERDRQDVMHDFGAIGNEEYLAILDERLAGEEEYSAAWAQLMQQRAGVLQDMANVETQALAHDVEIAQNRYALGIGTADAVIAALLAQLEGLEVFSAEWMRVWNEVVAFSAEAGATLSDSIRGDITDIATNLHITVPVFETISTGIGDIGSAASSAAEEVETLADKVRGAVLDLGNLVDVFGGEEFVDADEIEDMLEHRIEAARRWKEALADLKSAGYTQALIEQVAGAGPSGLGLAEALLGADSGGITALLAQLDTLAGSTGGLFGGNWYQAMPTAGPTTILNAEVHVTAGRNEDLATIGRLVTTAVGRLGDGIRNKVD